MFSPRWTKVLKDLLGNRVRTLLVVLSIAVGVFAVGAIASSQIILSRAMSVGYAAVNPAHASLMTTTFDQDLVDTIRNMREVKDAQGARGLQVRAEVAPKEWKAVVLNAVDDFDDIRINRITPWGGQWPPRNHEVLIERASLDFLRAKIGDTLKCELPDGTRRDLKIAGLVHDINQMPSSLANLAVGYVTMDTMEWLGEESGYDRMRILVNGDPSKQAYVQAVANRVRDKIEKSGRSVIYTEVPQPGKHPAADIVSAITFLMGVLGVLSLGLSGLLVVNTISSILSQHRRQIGIMKAIGGQTRQIVGMYLALVLAFGLLALVVALPLGAVGALGFSRFMAGLINFDVTHFEVPPTIFGVELAVALLVPVVAAAAPVIGSTRVTVREAISDYGVGKTRARVGLMERLLSGDNAALRAFSRPMLLSLRNTFRRKARLALTLTTLTLGGAIFIAIFSVRASTQLTLVDALAYWKYDVQVTMQREYRGGEMEQEAMSVPGVVRAESWGFRSGRRVRSDDSESENIILIAPPADTKMLQPTLLDGRWLNSGDENALVINTDLLRKEPDLKVGDDMTLKINNHETQWHIVGLVKGILAGPFGYANYPYFSRAVREVGRAEAVMVETKQHDMASQQKGAQALERHFKGVGMRVSSVETIEELRAMIQGRFDIIIVMLLAMAVLIGLVGGLGLMGTMSINVMERTREIGVMRAIGASDGSVLKIVMVEGIVIGLLSWSVGALIAVPASRLLSDAVGNLFVNAPLSYQFSAGGAVVWLGLVLAVACLASLLPARSASRLTIREVLAYE